MPKVTSVTLTADERAALEKAAKYGTTPSFRLRCQAILLKSEVSGTEDLSTEKRTSLEVAQQLGCCEMSVNDWLKRYQQQGLAGLQVQKGRGRKAILQADTDLAAVRQAVQGSRQRLSLAKFEAQSRPRTRTGQDVRNAGSEAVPEKNGCRYKRIRRKVKGVPNPDVYS